MHTITHIVPFKGDAITLIEEAGEPFVAIKPICERLGLQWEAQRRRLTADPGRWAPSIRMVPSPGGAQETTCLPARKLFGWLASISPSKVRPEVRDALTTYQRECDDVLWTFWSGGRTHWLQVLERSQAKLTGLFKAYVPWAGKLAALQEAGIFRSQVHLHLRSWSKGLVIEMIDELENAGVIDPERWADVILVARGEAYAPAHPDPDAPTVMERLIGADDHGH